MTNRIRAPFGNNPNNPYKWTYQTEISTIRKIRDLPKVTECRSPQHNRPLMIVLPEGEYEHTCPACGAREVFVIRKDYWL